MRAELKGYGLPNSSEALPNPTADGDLPPQRLLLPSGMFVKADYVSLGFTNFEVWCIGGAGGHGGDGYTGLGWRYTLVPKAGGGFITHWHDPTVDERIPWGGAGGGGGMHHAAGLLSDLPDATPVVVGEAGLVAVDGLLYIQTTDPQPDGSHLKILTAPITLEPSDVMFGVTSSDVLDPGAIFTVDKPRAGGDGGASIFNDGQCKASGGKGGGPTSVVNSSPTVFAPVFTTGVGGDGGAGNRTAAGGGAAGSLSQAVAGLGGGDSSAGANGADGTWDGNIGQGGGGGRGGLHIADNLNTPGDEETNALGSSGGQGSYSFGDTSVYGPREQREEQKPGGGGGAKIGPLQYGSHAPGFNPMGAVIIRLTKLD